MNYSITESTSTMMTGYSKSTTMMIYYSTTTTTTTTTTMIIRHSMRLV